MEFNAVHSVREEATESASDAHYINKSIRM